MALRKRVVVCLCSLYVGNGTYVDLEFNIGKNWPIFEIWFALISYFLGIFHSFCVIKAALPL